MTTKHTPAPWKIEASAAAMSTQQQDYLITYSDGDGLRSHIARLFDNALCTEHGTTLDNAKLIAAAPEMLDALRAIADYVAVNEMTTAPAFPVAPEKMKEIARTILARFD